MIEIKGIKFLIFNLIVFIIIQYSSSQNQFNSLTEDNVKFSYAIDKASLVLEMPQTNLTTNQTEIRFSKLTFISITERFRNNKTYALNNLKFQSVFFNETYIEQNIESHRSCISSNNFYNNDNIIKKSSQFVIDYLFFNDKGWIDDQTNYVREGNLMVELFIKNYPFCEDLVSEYNTLLEKNDTMSDKMKNFNLDNHPNCRINWIKAQNSNKLVYLDEYTADKSNYINQTYLELLFEINSNSEIKFSFDRETRTTPIQLKDYSYLRLYQLTLIDGNKILMQDSFPKIVENKYIIMQIPKFNINATNWIFMDIKYVSAPPNFKSFSIIAFYSILGLLAIALIYVIIRRKIIKEKLVLSEQKQNLNQI